MNSGLMRYRLLVTVPERVSSAFGDGLATQFTPWNGGRPIWAERRRLDTYGVIEQGAKFDDHRAEYNIRIAHKVEKGFRVQEVGSNILYEVKSVEPNIPRGYVTLKCERVDK